MSVVAVKVKRSRNNKEPMVQRNLRVPLALWEAAAELAAQEDRAVSDVVRDALVRYVRRKR